MATLTFLETSKQQMTREIKRLSQEEGLYDSEIARIIGCSRATVNRVRQANDIPIANLRNRKDKECVCKECGQVYRIMRKVRRKSKCMTCRSKCVPSDSLHSQLKEESIHIDRLEA